MYRENKICDKCENAILANGSSEIKNKRRIVGNDIVKINTFSSWFQPKRTIIR